MKAKWVRVALVGAFVSAASMTSFAAQGKWVEQNGRWWYDNEDGTYKQNGWYWIDGNSDGYAECYYFDNEGWMLANCITPDGYQVDQNGAWIENGVIASKKIAISDENTSYVEAPVYTGEFYSVTYYGNNYDNRLRVTDNGNNTYKFQYINAQGEAWWEYDAKPIEGDYEGLEAYYDYYIEFAEVGTDWARISFAKNIGSDEYYYGWAGEYWHLFE